NLMIALGLGSLLFAGLMLYRRRDVKRFFGYSSIEHVGIMTFAFGIGGTAANFAGLLHMAAHGLTKSSIFFAVGRIVQLKGTREIVRLSGIATSHPLLGWGFVLAVIASAGAPPFSIFATEFLIVTSAFPGSPALGALFALGLLIALGALLLRVQQIAFGTVTPSATARAPATTVVPLYAHLGLVVLAALWLPPTLIGWFANVSRMLG
ncbi:MAG: hydrogenase 4 subunit F, partial [Proteobacteria bacterium]|nr:hydrogenase 4 subunit F [Pseudomonadota bacterium]